MATVGRDAFTLPQQQKSHQAKYLEGKVPVWCTGKAEKLQIKINMVRSREVFRTEEINLFVPLAPPCDGVTDGNGLMFGKHTVEVPLL